MTGKLTELNMEVLRNHRVSIVPLSSDSPILEITFNDTEGQDRERPRITISYDDGTEQNIDVIGSIRNNAASIGHPLILYAIRRWEEIVRIQYHRSIRRDDSICEAAKKHLEEAGSALLVGSKERAVSKETSFTYNVYNSSCLDLAWKLLGEKALKNIRNESTKLEQLESLLINDRVPSIPPIDSKYKKRNDRFEDPRIKTLEEIREVIDFLKSEVGSGFLRKRRSYASMINAFDAWRSRLDIGTVRKYKSVALKKHQDQAEWFNPYFLVVNAINLSDILEADSLQLPLVVIPSGQDNLTVD